MKFVSLNGSSKGLGGHRFQTGDPFNWSEIEGSVANRWNNRGTRMRLVQVERRLANIASLQFWA